MKVHQSCRVDVEKIPGVHLFSGRCCEQEGKCARTMHEVQTVAGVHFFFLACCLCTIFHHRQHVRYHWLSDIAENPYIEGISNRFVTRKLSVGGLTFWNLIELHWFLFWGAKPPKDPHGGSTYLQIYFWKEFCIFVDLLHSESSWWYCCDMVKSSCVLDSGGMLKYFFKRLTNFMFERYLQYIIIVSNLVI